MKFPKPIKYKDVKYLNWLKGKPCIACGKPGEPHHVRKECWGAGMGTKPHDYCTVSLCRNHHDPAIESDFDIKLIIIDYLMKYIHENK